MSDIVQGLAGLISWGVLGLLIAAVVSLVRMTRSPAIPPFAHPRGAGTVTGQLRQDPNARFIFDRRGFLFQKRFFFVGTGCPPVRFTDQDLAKADVERRAYPVAVAFAGPRTWWWFGNEFYWDSSGYAASDA